MEVTHTNDGRIRNQGRQTDCELQVFFHGTFFRLIHSMVAETVGTVTQLIKEPRISQIWWPRPSSGRGRSDGPGPPARSARSCRPNAELFIVRDANSQARSPLIEADVLIIANAAAAGDRWIVNRTRY